MLARVYTCQNATLLEITCHGSNGNDDPKGQELHFQIVVEELSSNTISNASFSFIAKEVFSNNFQRTDYRVIAHITN